MNIVPVHENSGFFEIQRIQTRARTPVAVPASNPAGTANRGACFAVIDATNLSTRIGFIRRPRFRISDRTP